MRKTRTALLADERLLQESSFSLSFCLTVLVSQPVRLAALQRHDPDDEDASWGRERVMYHIRCWYPRWGAAWYV